MVDTVRDNPMPLALMGLGIGWLMFSGIREYRAAGGADHPSGRAGLGYGRAQGEDYDSSTGYGAYDSSDYGGADYTGYTEAATASSYGAEPSRGAGGRQASQSPTTVARQLRDRGGRTAGGMQEKARDLAGTTRTRMSSAGRNLRDRAGDLAGRSGATYRDHPLMIGSVALLIGAALGAALPRSEREDELLGEQSDEVMQRARAVGGQALDRAKHVARRTAEAARESGEEALGRISEAARQSADEAMEPAKGSAREGMENAEDAAARGQSDRQKGGEAGRLH